MYHLRRDASATWIEKNPVLAAGDTGFERDTGRMKIGDGIKDWVTLPYVGEAAGGGGSAPVKASFFEGFDGDLSAFSGAPGTYEIANSEFHPTGPDSNERGLWVPDLSIDRFVATVKFRYAGTKLADLYVLARLKASNHFMMTGYVNNNGTPSFQRYFRDPIRSFNASPGVNAPAIVVGTAYWLRVLVYDEKMQVAVYSVDPDSVPNPVVLGGTIANFVDIPNLTYPTLGVGAPGSVGILCNDFSATKVDGPFVDSLKIQEI
jgi:hypothetical protein